MPRRRKLFDSKREPKFSRDFESAIDSMELPPLDEMNEDSIHESYDKDGVFAAHSNLTDFDYRPRMPEPKARSRARRT